MSKPGRQFLRDLQSLKSNVYIKAVESLSEVERHRPEIVTIEGLGNDPTQYPEEQKMEKIVDPRSKINMCEIILELNYEAPAHYKEIRNGYKLYGDQSGLYVPLFSQTDFNFYKNNMMVGELSQRGFISPIASTANSRIFSSESAVNSNNEDTELSPMATNSLNCLSNVRRELDLITLTNESILNSEEFASMN